MKDLIDRAIEDSRNYEHPEPLTQQTLLTLLRNDAISMRNQYDLRGWNFDGAEWGYREPRETENSFTAGAVQWDEAIRRAAGVVLPTLFEEFRNEVKD